jgi:hypothetical protein
MMDWERASLHREQGQRTPPTYPTVRTGVVRRGRPQQRLRVCAYLHQYVIT